MTDLMPEVPVVPEVTPMPEASVVDAPVLRAPAPTEPSPSARAGWGAALPTQASRRKPASRLVRAGLLADGAEGAVVDPLHLSATYTFADFETPRAFDYARCDNPTRAAFVRALADLEGAAGGVATASGMAAVDLVLELVGPGERVLLQADAYGGSRRLLEARADKGAFTLELFAPDDLDALEAQARGAALIYAETPSNPLLAVVDLARLGAIARSVGARLVVDNTFASPLGQNPIAFGADLVIHSATKYINGHSDVIIGAVLAADGEVAADLQFWANAKGCGAGAFDCHQALRGLRTLAVRLERQQANAALLAQRLARDPRVAQVYYPGLESHPGHGLARRQQAGPGAMLTFQLAALADVGAFFRSLDTFIFAESLGGVESLACHPWSMSHGCLPESVRAELGVRRDLVRLSVGLEHGEDLWADLDAALSLSAAASRRAG